MKEKIVEEVDLLNDIAKTFAESLDLEKTLKSIFNSLDTHMKLRRGTITLLDPETETISIRVAHGLSDESASKGKYRIGEGITGMVVQSGKEIVVPDISKDQRFLDKTGSRRKSDKTIAFFCVPIKLENKTIGTLSVDRETASSEDFDADIRLLNVIATMVAQAVKLNKMLESDRKRLKDENLRLKQQLKSQYNIHNMVGTSNAIKEVYTSNR